jgi:hypothetical protein
VPKIRGHLVFLMSGKTGACSQSGLLGDFRAHQCVSSGHFRVSHIPIVGVWLNCKAVGSNPCPPNFQKSMNTSMLFVYSIFKDRDNRYQPLGTDITRAALKSGNCQPSILSKTSFILTVVRTNTWRA